MNQLTRGQRDSMGFSALNYFLYRAIVSSHSTINQKSLLPILQYLSAFLDTPPSSAPIHAVSYISFPPHKYLKCVKLLAARQFTEIQFPPMLRILAVSCLYDTEDRLIGELCSLLEPSASQFASSVVKWPEATVSEVIRSLLLVEENDSIPKDRLKVPQLASEILHSAIVRQKSADVTRLCFPYLAKIRTHPLYGTNRNLQEVQAAVWAAIQQEKFTPEVDSAPFSIFAGIEYEAPTFSAVPGNFLSANVRLSDLRNVVGTAPVKPRSLMAFLDADVKICLQPQVAPRPKVKVKKPSRLSAKAPPVPPGAPKPAAAIVKLPPPVIPKLRGIATKKKSGKFGGQSKYAYEFSAMNRSLVWRSENKRESVKGAVMIQQGVDVQRNATTVTIKSGGKAHEILFENGIVADLWFSALKKAVAAGPPGK